MSQQESFKLGVTSHRGRSEVKSTPQSPSCSLLGHANETDVQLGDKICKALVDTGSMITSVGESFYKRYLEKQYPLQELSDLLHVEGAGGHQLEYLGYAEMDITVPDHSATPLWVPILVAHDTTYNKEVPLIIGTNVIGKLKQSRYDDIWTSAINAVCAQEAVPEEVAVYCCKQLFIPPSGTVEFKGRLGPQEVKCGILEPASTLPGGLMLCRSVVSPDDERKVHVMLKNVSSTSIEIPNRQRVASLKSGVVLEPTSSDSDATLGSQSSEESASPREISVKLDEEHITDEDREKVQELLKKWNTVFAFSSIELGKAEGVKHSIHLTDNVPFKDKPRRIPPGMYDEVKQHLQDMIASGAIRPSNSPYSSGVVLVRKKDGCLRVCLDFRRLNSKTIRDAYFLPNIEETFDHLHGAKWFSSIDLQSGYWQVEMEEEDKPKTAFCLGSNLGFWECNRMPMGLTNAPATFQRLMETALKDVPNCFAYLDDIIIYSSGSVEDHLRKLEAVFQKLLACGLKLKPKKCHLLMKKIKYLGHIVSEDGIEADPQKVEVVEKYPLPTTVHELRQALGFLGYYRRFVKDFAKIAKPLHDLLKGIENKSRSNKHTPVEMTPEAVSAFELLKNKLISPPILAFADYSTPFELHIDASGQGLGGILYQQQEGKLRVIAYASRGLKPSETHYPAHKLEYLALKWAVCDKFKDYLYGNYFDVYTDSNPMSYVLSSAKLDATGHRWLAELSLYNFKIHYKPGKLNTDADVLSRLPTAPPQADVDPDAVRAMCSSGLANAGEVDTMDYDVVKALCQGVAAQDVGCVEKLGVSSSAIEFYEQNISPMNLEIRRTAEVWRDLQLQDPVLQQLLPAVAAGMKPDSKDCQPEIKSYLKQWDKLTVTDGVLYRTRENPDTEEQTHQLVLPTSEREQALAGLHDEVGHLGRERTLQLVRARYYWPRMTEDVKVKVRTCPFCVRRKSTSHRAPLVNIVTTQPMELVCIDFLSLEPSAGGIENLLVMTDHHTRLAYAISTRNQTAKTTAQALYSFFLHYGFPLKLHSDNGKNFTSKTIKELCKLAGIEKTRTTVYHPMGNGMCERFNSTLLGMLGCLTAEQKLNWKKYVPSVVHAYNATRHESTGYSPFYLMFGRHPRLAVDVAMGCIPKEPEVDFTKDLKNRLDTAYRLATAQAEKSKVRYKRQYDRRVKGSTVAQGDRVLLKNVGIRGKHKLANAWEDPVYVVMEQQDGDIPVFVVKREDGKGPKKTVHRNLLLPVNFLPLDPKCQSRKPAVQQKKQEEPTDSQSDSDVQSDSTDSEEEARYILRSRLNPLAKQFLPGDVPEDQGQDVSLQPDEGQDVLSEAEESVGSGLDEEGAGAHETVEEPVEEQLRPVPAPRRTTRERKPPDFYGTAVSHGVGIRDPSFQKQILENIHHMARDVDLEIRRRAMDLMEKLLDNCY